MTGEFYKQEFTFSFNELNIKESDINRMLGYDGTYPEPVPGLIPEVLAKAGDYCFIRGGYVLYDNPGFDQEPYSITIDDVSFSIGKILFPQMRKASRVAVFVCSAGRKIGEWSSSLMASGDFMKAYAVDVIATLILETSMDRIQEELKRTLEKKKWTITNRFSPGYCNWDVSEQKKLFSLLPQDFCKVKLNGGSVMDPVKSVSGIIGIGKHVEFIPNRCDHCTTVNCILRKRC